MGPYFGASLGSADLSIEVDEEFTYKTDKFTWGLNAGWQITQHFAVEAGYLKPGSIRESAGDDSVTGSFHAWTATLLGSYPMSERWSLYARLGGISATEKYSAVLDGLSYSTSDDTTELLYGVGAGVVVEGARIRFDYSRADFKYGEAGVFSLGVNWFFQPR